MAGSPSQEEGDEYSLFLLEGLARAPSPLVLIAADDGPAQHLALRLHSEPVSNFGLPPPQGQLLSLSTELFNDMTLATARAFIDELATTEHWLYVQHLDHLLDSAIGGVFLRLLLDAVSDGRVSAVIASLAPEQVDRLRREARRLLGFAQLMEKNGSRGVFEVSRLTTLVAESPDRSDTGWVVAVRYDLRAPVTPYVDVAVDSHTSAAMELVEAVHLINYPNRPPDGVMISLHAVAFTATQEAVAFETATRAARRVVGRPLVPGETVTATRGVFYA